MDDCGIKSLARRQKKLREPLSALPGADPVKGSTTTATPTAEGGSGIDSPLTEQPYAGSTYYQLISSDGLFVFEFPDETEYTDAAGREVVVKHLAP